MTFTRIFGIDVSKLTLDVHVLPSGQSIKVDNDSKGIKQLISWLKKTCEITFSSSLFAFEFTGFYSHKLAVSLQEQGFSFVMLPGLELKRSIGIHRGKSDPIDAEKIAEYVFLRREKISPIQLPEPTILKMKKLLSLRTKLVRQRAGFKATLRESKRALKKSEFLLYYQIQENMLKRLTYNIERLESQLHELVANHPELKKQYDLIVTIKGVGPLTALMMIATTHGFQKFENWRKFACYAGTAPFPYQSGSSIRGKDRISQLANKTVKSVLSNIANSAIRHNPEMKAYYQKRIEEGKSVMSTQNIIRNKLISRIFAVVKRGTPYVDLLKYAS